MIIELYASGTQVPALYDAFIDREGNLYGMNPQPPELHDIMQVVVDGDGGYLTQDQKDCIDFLIKINRVTSVHVYEGDVFVSHAVHQS
ncbi:hypothetical protein [Rhizobium sp. Nf11,1]|uniref:hypothetical protein n=1 Tax=Rhizobium sp. Nf11,1 TaxID=3404923 RepID=UPI003D33EEF9